MEATLLRGGDRGFVRERLDPASLGTNICTYGHAFGVVSSYLLIAQVSWLIFSASRRLFKHGKSAKEVLPR